MGARQALASATLLISASASAYDWQDAARQTGVSPDWLYAVAVTESGVGEGPSRRPWPWTLNAGGDVYRLADRAAAKAKLDALLEAGRRNIDIGFMQVNWRWNGDLVDEAHELLDPQVNLWAAAQVLRACRLRVGDRLADLMACYHAGPKPSTRGERYAQRVTAAATQLTREASHAD